MVVKFLITTSADFANTSQNFIELGDRIYQCTGWCDRQIPLHFHSWLQIGPCFSAAFVGYLNVKIEQFVKGFFNASKN